jgi:hypothetical protein
VRPRVRTCTCRGRKRAPLRMHRGCAHLSRLHLPTVYLTSTFIRPVELGLGNARLSWFALGTFSHRLPRCTRLSRFVATSGVELIFRDFNRADVLTPSPSPFVPLLPRAPVHQHLCSDICVAVIAADRYFAFYWEPRACEARKN